MCVCVCVCMYVICVYMYIVHTWFNEHSGVMIRKFGFVCLPSSFPDIFPFLIFLCILFIYVLLILTLFPCSCCSIYVFLFLCWTWLPPDAVSRNGRVGNHIILIFIEWCLSLGPKCHRMLNEIVFGVLHFYNSVRVQCSVRLGGYSSTCSSR